MTINYTSENILVIDLPFEEPDICKQLKALNETIIEKDTRDVVVNFFRVQILNSSSLSNLLILQDTLKKRNGRLILCHISTMTKYIFVVAGLEKVFEFIEDKETALAEIEAECEQANEPLQNPPG